MSDDDRSRSRSAARPEIDRLLEIMAALRTPVTGCPWDLNQSFETIAPYTIEEAYEVDDAIRRGDLADLKEELGDLLFQVVYHAQIAKEQGAFDFADVVDAVSEKMVRRHPHVFGTPEERAVGAAPGFWEKIKAKEKEKRAREHRALGQEVDVRGNAGLLDDIPLNLPALDQALKLQKRAASVGFDWVKLAPVLNKLREEVSELEEAVQADNPASVRDEFGDLLFVIANVARHLEVDAEASLRGTNAKFRRRFAYIESALTARGRTLEDASLEEMDALWNEAKVLESRE